MASGNGQRATTWLCNSKPKVYIINNVYIDIDIDTQGMGPKKEVGLN